MGAASVTSTATLPASTASVGRGRGRGAGGRGDGTDPGVGRTTEQTRWRSVTYDGPVPMFRVKSWQFTGLCHSLLAEAHDYCEDTAFQNEFPTQLTTQHLPTQQPNSSNVKISGRDRFYQPGAHPGFSQGRPEGPRMNFHK